VDEGNIYDGLSLEIKMSNESFEQRMERACRDREIPGAVLVAGDRKGR
jgi:hypothetical protein